MEHEVSNNQDWAQERRLDIWEKDMLKFWQCWPFRERLILKFYVQTKNLFEKRCTFLKLILQGPLEAEKFEQKSWADISRFWGGGFNNSRGKMVAGGRESEKYPGLR